MTQLVMEKQNRPNGGLIMTNLQRRILQLLAEGNSVAEVGELLEMDQFKVEILCQILLRKFEFSDLKHMVVMAHENGFIK